MARTPVAAHDRSAAHDLLRIASVTHYVETVRMVGTCIAGEPGRSYVALGAHRATCLWASGLRPIAPQQPYEVGMISEILRPTDRRASRRLPDLPGHRRVSSGAAILSHLGSAWARRKTSVPRRQGFHGHATAGDSNSLDLDGLPPLAMLTALARTRSRAAGVVGLPAELPIEEWHSTKLLGRPNGAGAHAGARVRRRQMTL